MIFIFMTDEVPFYAAADERIVELQGEALKVQKALEAVVGHLRKFLVDHSVLPLFERTVSLPWRFGDLCFLPSWGAYTFYVHFQYNATISQERQSDTWVDKSLLHGTSQTGMGSDYSLPAKREPLYHDRETPMEHSGFSMYGQEHGLSGIRSSGLGRAVAPIVTQVGIIMIKLLFYTVKFKSQSHFFLCNEWMHLEFYSWFFSSYLLFVLAWYHYLTLIFYN